MRRSARWLGWSLLGFFTLAVGVVVGVGVGLIEQPAVALTVDRLWARNFGTLEPGIYRGGQPGNLGRRWLTHRYDFASVIHLAWRDTEEDRAEAAFFKGRGAEHHAIPWQPEGPPTPDELERILALVRDAPRPTFVHCIGGKDRTAGVIGLLGLERGQTLEAIVKDWRRYGTPSRGWQEALRDAPRGPLHPFERVVEEVTAVHGGAGPFAVAGHRMGQAALERLGIPRGSADLEVVHYGPRMPAQGGLVDGLAAATGVSLGRFNLTFIESEARDARTVFRNRVSGQTATLRLVPGFEARFLDTPPLSILDAGQRVLRLGAAEIFVEEDPGPGSG